MKNTSQNKIKININHFLIGNGSKNKGRNPNERYSSFDYCYNYFQDFREPDKINELTNNENLGNSCLQLGFYLASWGMLRGSSFLLEKSLRHYITLLNELVKFDKRIWDIDVDCYSDENINLLLEFKHIIKIALGESNNASDTLTTKIMLGIMGNIPAFDSYFNKGFGFYYCKKNQLKKIGEFYNLNSKIIDKYSSSIKTYDVLTGNETNRRYSKAKIIDMYGFMEGLRK